MKKFLKLMALMTAALLAFSACQTRPQQIEITETEGENGEKTMNFPDFITNTSKHSIDFEDILSGGPGKDGIPAINDPKFINIDEAELPDDSEGILVVGEKEVKYYPFSILVWHEIVNDTIDELPVAVTFCPLCGSSIVYKREINEEIVKFGVSGFLFESNLLMYDDLTESFWSQSRGEAVVGDYTGQKLEIYDAQILAFADVKSAYPKAKILSDDTGFNRSYGFYPYGSYEETEEFIFPVSVEDKRFFSKEIFYIVPLENNSIAVQQTNLQVGQKSRGPLENGAEIEVAKTKKGLEVKVDGKKMPGYFEMWFSWATHNQENGLVYEP
jgi:hypothetical protein